MNAQITRRMIWVNTKIQGLTFGKRHWETEEEKRERVPKATNDSRAWPQMW